jgi:hypothetical protein
MYCVQCGAATVPGESFCPRCGKPVANAPAMSPPAPAQSRVAGNLKLLAIFWFILSVIRLIPGLMMFFIFGSIQGFLPADVPGFVHGLLQFISYILIAVGGIGLITGWGLLQRQPWARMLALVMGLLSLVDIPFGTAVGIYTLWVLAPSESEAEYRLISQTA